MKQATKEDLRTGLGDVLNRFGIDKESAKKARQELTDRIEPIEESEAQEEGDKYFVYFYRHFGIVDISIEELLIPSLELKEQSIYRRLYHLAYNTIPRCNWCQVSIPKLAEACNVSQGTARSAIKGLIQAECIKVIAEASRHEAPVYRVYLPCEISRLSGSVIVDDEGNEKDVMSGVIFLREEVRPAYFRGLNFRALKSRPLKSGPLKFKSLDELRGTILRGLNSKSRGLNFAGLDDEDSDNNGLASLNEGEEPPINILNREEEPLSPRDLVDLFYTGIGQKKISKTKRERAEKDIEKLNEQFSLEEIKFAVKWTLRPGNTKEKPRSFGIVHHTIDQAILAMHKEQKAAQKTLEQQAASEAAAEEQKRIETEIETLRSDMTKKQLADLTARTKKEILESGEYKEQFITDQLIRAKENEILLQQNKKKNKEQKLKD